MMDRLQKVKTKVGGKRSRFPPTRLIGLPEKVAYDDTYFIIRCTYYFTITLMVLPFESFTRLIPFIGAFNF